VLFTPQRLAPAKQFGVDLGEFLELGLQLAVMFDAVLSGSLLIGGFEWQFVDFADGQALGQIVERAVFMTLPMTVAVGFAAAGEALHERGAQTVGPDLELRSQKAFALPQGQRGLASEGVYLCHMYGEDMKTGDGVNKNENGEEMRKCLTALKH
jgi:hypothetical protein